MASDDFLSRRVVLELGLLPIGTLGIMPIVKRVGAIVSLSEYLRALGAMGMYLSETLTE